MELRLLLVVVASLPIITVTIGHPVTEDNALVNLCPEDSVLVNGTCECDHSLCEDPPHCNEELTLIRNSSGTPGVCCAEYTCGMCTRESITAGVCMCAVGAILRPDGVCECTDIGKRIEDGVCVCDSTKCPPLQECDDKSVVVKQKDECCTTHACIRCSEDSYPRRTRDNLSTSGDDEIEAMCDCFPCEPLVCTDGIVKITRIGTGFPGKCCDHYECQTNCTVDGKTYINGELIETNHTTGVCKHGVIIYQEANEKHIETCLDSNNNMYENGQEWNEEDNCTKCICQGGEAKCITDSCIEEKPIITIKPKCKLLTHCSKTCPGGYKINKEGCPVCKCKTHEVFQNDLLTIKKFMFYGNLSESDLINIIEDQEKLVNLQKFMSKNNLSEHDVIVQLEDAQAKTMCMGYTACLPSIVISCLVVLVVTVMVMQWPLLKRHISKKVDDKCDKSSCNLLPEKS